MIEVEIKLPLRRQEKTEETRHQNETESPGNGMDPEA